jgi:glycosyltransferase involved in cell wall biosynthesis
MDSRGVLFDLTEFLRKPMRSGIQRVTFEVVRHWPTAGGTLLPVRVSADGQLLRLPSETFAHLRDYFSAVPGAAEVANDRLVQAGQELGEPLPTEEVGRSALLNTEVFTGATQLAFYEGLVKAGLGRRIFLLVYDMLPWLQPQWFRQAIVTFPLPYLRLLPSLPNLAFISGRAREDFLTRVLRRERATGPVLPLGADGLGREKRAFDAGNRRFSLVGTLEPRKNVTGVLDAFADLWGEGVDARLVCAGRMGWLAEADQDRVRRLNEEEPRFTWLDHPTDGEVKELIRNSRATIYASWAEGFGLPPLESLALGVPVIVSGSLPSVADLEPLGQIRLPVPEAAAIREAVRRLLDDGEARRLQDEVERLCLPDWQGFGRELAGWVAGGRAAAA